MLEDSAHELCFSLSEAAMRILAESIAPEKIKVKNVHL